MYKKRVRTDTRLSPLDDVLIKILYEKLKVPAKEIADTLGMSLQHVYRIIRKIDLEDDEALFARAVLKIRLAELLGLIAIGAGINIMEDI